MMRWAQWNCVRVRVPVAVCVLCASLATQAWSQATATVPVVMLSDIHFDPFHDPAKLDKLRTAPVTDWPKILDVADAPTQTQDVAALQQQCPVRGIDTPWTLLQSSLTAALAQQPKPLFVTVSGDLMSHSFDCRFKALAKGANDADYEAFAAKTVAFVAQRLHSAFAGVPVYLALGNNDSGCGDYNESPHSAFLQAVASSFAADADEGNRNSVLRDVPGEGDYSVALPKPMQHARLIVLQDVFESKNYKNCGADTDAKGADTKVADAQIEWLRAQLAAAKVKHEHVWVLAHIPPGVNVYSTFAHHADVCTDSSPVMFLNSEKIVDVLTEYADEVSLAVFGHTHMDEMRLLHADANPTLQVPVKLVASISPVNGNLPTFTVAQVDPNTATLIDYTVYISSNSNGINATWSKEYRYADAYGLRDYSAQSLANLFGSFATDKSGSAAKSMSYSHYFFPGIDPMREAAMHLTWPMYACSLTNNTADQFRSCMCPAKP